LLPEQRPFAVVTSLALLGLIIYLIRRRKLREEYALLWLGVGLFTIVLALWYGLLEWLTRLIGAVAPTTTLFIFAILFLAMVAIHYSISLSRLKDQVRDLTQELALLRKDLEADRKSKGGG
jgi:hypothetical protein